ncbi:Berberine bridge enzyme-like 2 [Vitis vinifera]|uniref:Berberine bridge enzyme-like 2 n=1 Tax=Vitis vinifera TaxID=29760 RepID=A0A438DZH8_VITVI|nr:Berberine bridge enzyme-like 2 [Vitis vinifera]
MKIRSGGHDYEGVSYVSDVPFFILDMFNLRSISVDIEDESAWVQAGATLGEFTIGLPRKQDSWLSCWCNVLRLSWLMLMAGFSTENSMGEDLFWAIRGGGGASYGVIVSYKIKLVQVPATVTVFRVARTLEQNATNIVYQWQQVADKVDDYLFIRLTMDVSLSSSGQTLPLELLLRLCLIETLKYSPLEEEIRLSEGTNSKGWFGGDMEENDRATDASSDFNPYGGKMAEISPSATPFHTAQGTYAKSSSPQTGMRKGFPREAFLNYRDLDLGINHNGKNSYLEGRVYGISIFKKNFNRLVRIKTKVDPGNFFRNEQSIPTLPY